MVTANPEVRDAFADAASTGLKLEVTGLFVLLLWMPVQKFAVSYGRGVAATVGGTVCAVGLVVFVMGGTYPLVSAVLFEYRVARGREVRPDRDRSLGYVVFFLAYEAHELVHQGVAHLLGAETRRVYGRGGRPGTLIRWPREAPEWRRVAADVAPSVVGGLLFVVLTPWLLGVLVGLGLESGLALGRRTAIEDIARILVGAQLAVFSWPSLEDLTGIAQVLGFGSGRTRVSGTEADD